MFARYKCADTAQDLTFGGGIVHSIDSPLIPPQDIIPTTSQYHLTAFQGALFATKQTEPLTAARGITIFAPSTDAFRAIGSTISQLTVEQLTSVLSYHIISNQTLYSTDLKNGTSLITASGQRLTVLESGNKLFINTAQITEKDILLKNGVLHTIDTVLNPDAKPVVPDPAVPTQTAVWSGASSVESVPFTSAIPCSTACEPTGTAVGGAGGNQSGGSGSVRTSSSKAVAAARETVVAARVMGVAVAAVGGAAMLL